MKVSACLVSAALFFARPAPAQQLLPFGLEGKTVTGLQEFFGTLYASTQEHGVYRRQLAGQDTGWISLGVPAKNLNAIFAFHTVCPLKCWKGILVGAAPAEGDSALLYFYQQSPDTCEKKRPWTAADSGIDRALVNQIDALAGTALCQPVGPEFVTAFAAGRNFIWRSYDRGKHWQLAWQGTASSRILALAAQNRSRFDLTHEEVWAGGYVAEGAAPLRPLVLRSLDSGQNWEDRSFFTASADDEVCYAVASDPEDTNLVFAALSNRIVKSQDGGRSWNTVLANTLARFSSILVHPKVTKLVLAGGTAAGSSFALYESRDGGEHWNLLFANHPAQGLSSIAFDPFLARDPPPRPEIAYLATLGSGVWLYSLSPTGTGVGEEPAAGTLRRAPLMTQNFPNPFNPGTMIRFEIPPALANAEASLAIYDLNGDLVRELIQQRLPAGNHAANWDGKDQAGAQVSSGIYFYLLQVGNVTAMRKLSLVK